MTVAGYSGTPLGKKLGIKPGHQVWLIAPPANLSADLEAEIPATYSEIAPDKADVILLFVRSASAFTEGFGVAAARLVSNGGLWVCWPKKASGVPTDLTENFIRDHGLSVGLVDNKICAVDATWSGLRFVIRVKDRASASG